MKHQQSTSHHVLWLMLSLFVVFATTLGFVIGKLFDVGTQGAILMVSVALLYVIWAYFMTGKTIITLLRAQTVPEETNAHLYKRIGELAQDFHVQPPSLFYINDEAINSCSISLRGNTNALVLTKGLMEKLTTSEVEAVLAHEFAHIASGDVQIMTLSVTTAACIPFLTETSSKHLLSKPLSFVLPIFLPLSALALQLIIPPKREVDADTRAVLITRYPEGLLQALHKSAQDPHSLKHIYQATAHLFFTNPYKARNKSQRLFSLTHPKAEERMQILREL